VAPNQRLFLWDAEHIGLTGTIRKLSSETGDPIDRRDGDGN
jgi:hypothetical protein